ncbi:MAG TPA: MmgE/PrpD family protein [Ramlibacter sp.]|nr:MmgE/PrpD family protein [Ramlibacter sp.]
MVTSQLNTVCRFVSESRERPLSSRVLDLAKQCLVDWFAVSLAACPDAAPSAARQMVRSWATQGRAMNLYGDVGAAGPMALVNGTLSHSLDFDDMHFGSAFHATGPTLAATLAVAMDRGCTEAEVLSAFVTGYEVGVAMGEAGIGPSLLAAGWHVTGVLGHFSSASAIAALLQLNPAQTAHAFGLAATQAAGLQASGGTMAKPFHVGKAAMNGVMAAELALLGMDSNTGLFDDARSGVLGCLFQQPTQARFDSLGRVCQLEGNTFKPYASCQLTHAPYEAARGLADGFRRHGLKEVRVTVNPLAPKIAGRATAATPMEGRFSIAYCVALGLLGHSADMSGFTDARLLDAEVQALSRLVRVHPSEEVERWSARIELDYGNDTIIHNDLKAVRGSPSRPLSWSELDEKFLAATAPALGESASQLLDVLHSFEQPVSLAEMTRILNQFQWRQA